MPKLFLGNPFASSRPFHNFNQGATGLQEPIWKITSFDVGYEGFRVLLATASTLTPVLISISR